MSLVLCQARASAHAAMWMQANRSLLRTLDVFQESVLLLDAAQPEWQVLYANEAWTQSTGGEHQVSRDAFIVTVES